MSEAGTRWDRRRSKIVDAAAELFAAKGYDATGIVELCGAVGLGKGALYYYIESKENLLALIHDRVIDQVIETGIRISQMDAPASERLRLLGEVQIQIVADYPSHVRVFLHEYRALSGERGRKFHKSRRRFEKIVLGILEDGVNKGEFKISNKRLAMLGWLGMHNYTYLWYRPSGRNRPDEVSKVFFELFLHGVAD